jgi:hypothetical protein
VVRRGASVDFLGTSLHGRIAAIAMRVPTVNFENYKVKVMVETWGGARLTALRSDLGQTYGCKLDRPQF